MTDNLGMGMDQAELWHVTILGACHPAVLLMHMMADHGMVGSEEDPDGLLPDRALERELRTKGTLMDLHMHVHSHVIQTDN